MVRRTRKGGGVATSANLALCRNIGSMFTKRYLALVRTILIEYLIENPSRAKCLMNSNQLITDFVRAETAKKSVFSNLYWKATDEPSDRLRFRWLLDRIRTDNEFRVACASGDKAKMVVILDEYIRRFREHACDELDPDRYSDLEFHPHKDDINSQTNDCIDLGYRVSCVYKRSFGGRRKRTRRRSTPK
jgi:hypothetical protein